MQRNENVVSESVQTVNQVSVKVTDELRRLSSFITSLVFYYGFVSDQGDIYITSPLKCAPIISLLIYIYLKGFKFNDDYLYSQLVMGGLMFSCLGDFLLNLDYFPAGMAAFGLAQLFYISAFEVEAWRFEIGIPLYILAGCLTAYIFNSLEIIIKIGLPIYAFLLTTMCWRCIVRATVKKDRFAVIGAVGSILFVISDTLISLTMFVEPIPNARIFVMTTYYAAQFCISLSTISDVLKPKKTKGSKKLSRKFRDQD